jgi:hypothetical protein
MSAAPSRDVPSFSTGKPVGRAAPLTREEVEVALASRRPGDTDEAAIQRYQYHKQQMLKMKAAGQIDDRR